MPQIRVKTGPHRGRVFPIADAPITIGREDNQIIQILDQGVSRAHAEILRIGELCFVRDHNSTNGTFVNEARVAEETLKAGDELLIGTTVLVFEDDPPGAKEAVQFEREEPAEKEKETTSITLKVDDQAALVSEATGGRESRNLRILHQVGAALRKAPRIEDALEKTVDLVCAGIKASFGLLFMVDRDGGRLTPQAVVRRDEAEDEDKVSRTIVSRAQRERLALLTTDAGTDERFSGAQSIILKRIKSVVCAPVVVGDRVDAILYFHSNAVDVALGVEDLELATSVALQLSTALAGAAAGERLRRGFMGTIRALVTAMEIVDPRDQGHSQRVADYAAAVAVQLGLPAEEIHRVRLAALLHDVGKLAARHSIQGATLQQLDEQHVLAGERLLTGIEGFEDILPGVRYHHERADGSGFPYRLRNADTPVMARIIIVANAFDNACSSGGPDGAPRPSKDVVRDLAPEAGKLYDEAALNALLVAHRNGSLYGKAPE